MFTKKLLLAAAVSTFMLAGCEELMHHDQMTDYKTVRVVNETQTEVVQPKHHKRVHHRRVHKKVVESSSTGTNNMTPVVENNNSPVTPTNQ